MRSSPTSVRSWRTSVRSSWISVRSRWTSVRSELAVASLVTITLSVQHLTEQWLEVCTVRWCLKFFSNNSNRAEVVVTSSFGWRNNTWRYQANEKSSCRSSVVNISTQVWDGVVLDQQGETRSSSQRWLWRPRYLTKRNYERGSEFWCPIRSHKNCPWKTSGVLWAMESDGQVTVSRSFNENWGPLEFCVGYPEKNRTVVMVTDIGIWRTYNHTGALLLIQGILLGDTKQLVVN